MSPSMFMAWNFTCIWNFSLCHPLLSKRDINLGWERWAHWSRRIGLKAFASWCHGVSNLQFRYHSLGGFKEKGMTTITELVRNSFSPACCTEVLSPTTERITGILNGKGWRWQISCNGHFLVPVVCVWWCKMALKYFFTSSAVRSWTYDCIWQYDCKIPKGTQELTTCTNPESTFFFHCTKPFKISTTIDKLNYVAKDFRICTLHK